MIYRYIACIVLILTFFFLLIERAEGGNSKKGATDPKLKFTTTNITGGGAKKTATTGSVQKGKGGTAKKSGQNKKVNASTGYSGKNGTIGAGSKIKFCTSKGGQKWFCEKILKLCKETARSPSHCVGVAISIAYAESSLKGPNCFGITSKDKSIEKWIKSYNKYWYKAKDGYFFYGDKNKIGRSRYCVSEESSGSKKGCPNGRKNFDFIFTQYKKLFPIF